MTGENEAFEFTTMRGTYDDQGGGINPFYLDYVKAYGAAGWDVVSISYSAYGNGCTVLFKRRVLLPTLLAFWEDVDAWSAAQPVPA